MIKVIIISRLMNPKKAKQVSNWVSTLRKYGLHLDLCGSTMQHYIAL